MPPGLVSSTRTSLGHRRAASDRYDRALADDLAAYAQELHDRGEYREAGRHLAWSAEASADSTVREARRLDGLFEYVLVRDDEFVAHSLSDVAWAADDVRRGLLTAGLAIIRRRWLEGRRLLEAVDESALAATDQTTRYRVVLLRGWSRVMTGDPASPEAVADLTWARGADPDPALFGYLSFAYGQVRMATARRPEGWRYADALTAPTTSVGTDTTRLAWRGAVYALGGRFEEATEILDEVTRRARDGLAGFGEGVFHAYLGYACWMLGDWPRAVRMLTLAAESRFGTQHPMVMAGQVLTAIARNDPDGAVASARTNREILLQAPWPPAIQVAGTADVLSRRLFGTTEDRANILPGLRRRFGGPVTHVGMIASPVWLVHLGLASVWADDGEQTARVLARLRTAYAELSWLGPAGDWIEGLAAESDGDRGTARRLLISASSGGLDGLPLHRALVAEDLARVEAELGHHAAAAAARKDSHERRSALGLTGTRDAEAGKRTTVLEVLSDRERDVVGLLVEGLSYAQIARELYVTRSTVSFHLTNAYAKTNTTSRHELVDLVRHSG